MRATSESDLMPSDGIVTPIPEDPNVAVSVAYAFGAAGGGDTAKTPPSQDDDLDDRPTVQIAAVSPEMVQALGESDGTADDEDDLDSRKTREMPAIRLDQLGFTSSSFGGESGDSVEISIDDTDAAEARSGVRTSAVSRAATVALSDEDLEELIEPMETAATPPPKRKQRAARLMQAVHGSGEELDSRATQPLPVLDDASAAKPRQKPPEPGIPAAVAALEGAGMESPHDTPLVLGDASDSGEILSDDLIEEVEDSDVDVKPMAEPRKAPPPAPPTAAAPPKKTPPPSPKKAKADAAAQSGKPRRREGKPWFEEIFDEDYLRTLPFLTPQATQTEAAFVASALNTEPGKQLLDIGCGYGRHAMELAARGYQVVALDLSLPLLLRGADEAQRRGLNINFVHGDMRELNFETQFDGAYCLFSTFGYFDDETNKKTAQGIAQALKPGARWVVEVLNRDYLIADLPARVWWEGDGCVVLEEVDFNYFSSRIASRRSVVFDDGRQLEQEISMRAYSLHELGKLLHGAGFRVIEISGSIATRGRFFGSKSREIIVVAEKRTPKESKDVAPPVRPRASTSAEAGSPE